MEYEEYILKTAKTVEMGEKELVEVEVMPLYFDFSKEEESKVLMVAMYNSLYRRIHYMR